MEKKNIWIGLVSILFLMGCAKKIHFLEGSMLVSGHSKNISVVSSPLKAVSSLTIFQDEKKSSVHCAVAMIPQEKILIQFTGPLGIHLGSYYAIRDSAWVWINHREKQIVKIVDKYAILDIIFSSNPPSSIKISKQY